MNDIKHAKKIKFLLNNTPKCPNYYNPNYLDDILKKLPSVLVRTNYKRFTLQNSDEIFKRIRIQKLKEKINHVKKIT